MDDPNRGQNRFASEGLASAPEWAAEPSEERPKRPHSAVTSGRKLLLDGDANSAWSRRYRDVIASLTSDLGGRGMVTEAKAALIRDCAALEIVLEKMRGRMSADIHVDVEKYARIAAHRRRLLESIGLERVARDVTPPTLECFLTDLNASRAAETEQ